MDRFQPDLFSVIKELIHKYPNTRHKKKVEYEPKTKLTISNIREKLFTISNMTYKLQYIHLSPVNDITQKLQSICLSLKMMLLIFQ